MIARIWHGWTTPANADRYEALLTGTVLPDITARELPGYRGADLLRRTLNEVAKNEGGEPEVEFVTVLWFDSLANVQAFTGADYAVAHVPPEARRLLSRFDARSQHYDHILDRDRA